MDAALPADPFAVTSPEQLAALYDPPQERVIKKVVPALDAQARAFLERSPFCLIATVGARGAHCTPRGDAPGFVAALDDRTIALPDRRGNNRLDALRDVLDDPCVALLFLVPGVGETLRVNGAARLTTDPSLRARFAVDGREPATVMLVRIAEVYMQCARAVLRAKLWGGRARPEGVPTAGEMLAAHTGGMVDPATYDSEIYSRAMRTLY